MAGKPIPRAKYVLICDDIREEKYTFDTWEAHPSMEGAYHGDTLGTMAVGERSEFHRRFTPWLFPARTFPAPVHSECAGQVERSDATDSLAALEALLVREATTTACVILEPRVQGAAGMVQQPAGFVKSVAALCRKHGVHLILDEVFTGFGRVGSLTVAEAIDKVPELHKLYEQDDRHQQLLDFAIALEGLSRHAGVHAAGVVIAPGPLDEYVPVCTQETKGSGSAADDERVVVTQYDMNALERAGMLKMDFLGLTTLTIIHHTLENIRARGREVPDLDTLPLDDDATYRALRAGRTAGVFQFESPLATDMVRSMRADRFDDLVASNALMRPGPLDAGMHRVYCKRKKGEEPEGWRDMVKKINGFRAPYLSQGPALTAAQKKHGFKDFPLPRTPDLLMSQFLNKTYSPKAATGWSTDLLD